MEENKVIMLNIKIILNEDLSITVDRTNKKICNDIDINKEIKSISEKYKNKVEEIYKNIKEQL